MLKQTTLVSSLVLICSLRFAAAQVAPTGSHYAGRASDTGHAEPSNSGGYSTSVPLDLPPARGGLPVPVAVVSGSRGFGAAGVGWDVPLSFVHVDRAFGRRRPAAAPSAPLHPRERITVALPGRSSIEMLQIASASPERWIGRYAPDVTMAFDGALWKVFDGDGVIYTFRQDPTLHGTGGPSGGGLWLLDTISGAGGTTVQMSYSISKVTVGNSPKFALAVDLVSVSYNRHPSAGCFKHEISLQYQQPWPVEPDPATLALRGKPQSFSVLGDRVLTRDRRLAAIDVKSRATCGAQPELLRQYSFTYSIDPDTRQEQLAAVTMSGRAGTPEEHVSIPVASYRYGHATVQQGAEPALRYEHLQRIAIQPSRDRSSGLGSRAPGKYPVRTFSLRSRPCHTRSPRSKR